jgi:N-acetyl-D-muramate 6-phosphate phosphatase
MKTNIKAIIWDYDGTLVDTREKNLNVLREIVLKVMNKEYANFKCLLSTEKHQEADYKSKNWQELYSREFEMNEEQVNYAGSLWSEYQLLNTTQCKIYNNLPNVIKKLRKYPMGIVSQNASQNIKAQLKSYKLDKYFTDIIGYQEVDYRKQKPNPEGLINCISRLNLDDDNGPIIYIGDHETDVFCARNANEVFERKIVFSIAALYDKPNHIGSWKYKPDYVVNYPQEITEIIEQIE